jgi:hypothetical protein
VTHAAEVVNLVVTTHVPPNVVRVLYHNLGYGCRPTSATDDSYATTIVHILLGTDYTD